MKIKISYCILVFLLTVNCSQQREIIILSPDGKNKLTIIPGYERDGRKCPAFTLEAGNRKLLLPSCINLTTTGNLFESDFKVKNVARESVENQWTNNFGERKEVPDNYNQAKIFLENDEIKINLIYRAYNEGIAFAYEFPDQEGKDSVAISDEKISFNFTSDHYAWSAARAQAQYSRVPLSIQILSLHWLRQSLSIMPG
jgi:alpha-glucosidase